MFETAEVAINGWTTTTTTEQLKDTPDVNPMEVESKPIAQETATPVNKWEAFFEEEMKKEVTPSPQTNFDDRVEEVSNDVAPNKNDAVDKMSMVWLMRQADRVSDIVREDFLNISAEDHQALKEFLTKHNALNALIPSDFNKVKDGNILIDYSKMPEAAKEDMIIAATSVNEDAYKRFENRNRNHNVAEVQAARKELWDTFHDSKGMSAVKNFGVALAGSALTLSAQPLAWMFDQIDKATSAVGNTVFGSMERAGGHLNDALNAVGNKIDGAMDYLASGKAENAVNQWGADAIDKAKEFVQKKQDSLINGINNATDKINPTNAIIGAVKSVDKAVNPTKHALKEKVAGLEDKVAALMEKLENSGVQSNGRASEASMQVVGNMQNTSVIGKG